MQVAATRWASALPKIVVGALCLWILVPAAFYRFGGYAAAGALVFGLVLLVLLVVFVGDLRRGAAVRGERRRAEQEWDVLRADIAAARRARTNVARMLQQRGYRQFEVRRWILAEIGDGAGELDAS